MPMPASEAGLAASLAGVLVIWNTPSEWIGSRFEHVEIFPKHEPLAAFYVGSCLCPARMPSAHRLSMTLFAVGSDTLSIFATVFLVTEGVSNKLSSKVIWFALSRAPLTRCRHSSCKAMMRFAEATPSSEVWATPRKKNFSHSSQALMPHIHQAVVVFLAVLLEEVAQVQDRLRQNALIAQPERDEQPSHASVSIQKRVDNSSWAWMSAILTRVGISLWL